MTKCGARTLLKVSVKSMIFTLFCSVVQVHVVCEYLCIDVDVQVRWGSRVRRCCRALLTAAGNQSTLSVYSTTRRFLNDLP